MPESGDDFGERHVETVAENAQTRSTQLQAKGCQLARTLVSKSSFGCEVGDAAYRLRAKGEALDPRPSLGDERSVGYPTAEQVRRGGDHRVRNG